MADTPNGPEPASPEDWFMELTEPAHRRWGAGGSERPQESHEASLVQPGGLHPQTSAASPEEILGKLQRLGSRTVTPPPWFIGPCIKQGDCAYFVGEGGAGKSTLVADIMTAILDPGRTAALAGAWKINRKLLPSEPRALVINAETSLCEDWELHLMRANAAAGHTPNGPEDVEIRRRVEFLDRDDINPRPGNLHATMVNLASAIIEGGFTIVVIDPVYALFAPGQPGDDEWVTLGMQALVRRLKTAGVTMLAITHPPEVAPGKGVSLKAQLKPYGSSQQKGQMDAHFGLRRAGEAASELIKFKDRRAGWIPLKARIRLMWNATGGGYTQYTYVDSHWEYDNPHEFILSAKAQEIMAQLPASAFRTDHVKELGIRRATFLEQVQSYYEPQGLLLEEALPERGAPRRYEWTERGLRARELAIQKFPKKKSEE